ncbi:MAG: M3 family metallopeptidase [Planctomycetota bacterium]
MIQWIAAAGLVSLCLVGCLAHPGGVPARESANPLLEEWRTPFGVPPLDRIETGHFVPAMKEAMARHKVEIEAICNDKEAPTFANTIEALDGSGRLLERVGNAFDVLGGVVKTEEMIAADRELTPLRTAHEDDINLNERLFQRVKAVHGQRDQWNLDGEQARLLDEIHDNFVRGGADLPETKKAEFRALNERLAMLSLQFDENLLKATNKFELVITDQADLAGLPDGVIQEAAKTATDRGHPGKWVFTTQKPSMLPFLENSSRRELRERLFKGYINRCDHGDELDNKSILAEIAALRVKRANLLGYPTHAHYVLEKNMAGTPEAVYGLLEKVWRPAMATARNEVAAMQKIIEAEGNSFKLGPWDWWYCAAKVKQAEYDLDDNEVRPYFPLESVRDGAFMVAGKLYGLQFRERSDIPVYHEEVKVFEVLDESGRHVGLLYTDYHPRATKRVGAWMNAFRKQGRQGGDMVTPIITNNGNFTRPVGDTPSLLSFDEVATLFHEFGHALHGLLSDCRYNLLSGTSVTRDFVELPSQIMENWAGHPEVLKLYARHYRTGESIPQALIDKIEKASKFNQGFITGEYLAASFLDMDWHTLGQAAEVDVHEFEDAAMERIGLIPEIVSRYRSPYFRHVFASGYSAGYYSYIWAAVLDADAFEAFKEKGLFDRTTAESFRENVLSRGNGDNPMTLYKKFRGREPDVGALLGRLGFQ